MNGVFLLLKLLTYIIIALSRLIDKRNWFFHTNYDAIRGFDKLRSQKVLCLGDRGFKELYPVIEKELKNTYPSKFKRIELVSGGLASYIERPEYSGVSYDLRIIFNNSKDVILPFTVKAIEDYYHYEQIRKEGVVGFLIWCGIVSGVVYELVRYLEGYCKK